MFYKKVPLDRPIISERTMRVSMPIASCEVCGSSKSAFFFKARSWNWAPDKTFSLFACSACGFVYLNESISCDALNALYSHPVNKKGSGFGIGCATTGMRLYMKSRAKKIEAFSRPGAILDVGCAQGLFLEEMQARGWQSYGVDIAPAVRNLPDSKENITFLCGLITSIAMPESFFNAVTFWHSFEHMRNPCAVLAKVRALLKDDGILFISVPNIESFEARMNKSKWFGLELPAHCCHYSESSLTRLLERSGFTVCSLRKNSLEYNFPFFAQSLFNSAGGVHNFLQKKCKGYAGRNRSNPLHEAYTVAVTVALLPLAVVMTVALYFVNIATGNGPVIEMMAKKK